MYIGRDVKGKQLAADANVERKRRRKNPMDLLELLYTHIFIRYTVGFRRKALKFCSRVIWGNWELPRDPFDAKHLKFQIEISVYFPIHPPYRMCTTLSD